MSADEKNLIPAATPPGVAGIFTRRYLWGRVGMLTTILPAAAAVVVALIALRPLVPGGTLRAALGLPSVILALSPRVRDRS